MTTTYKPTLKAKMFFTAKRFLNFLKIFRRNKRGLFGIGIIIFYSTLAIIAPLLTPNDPTYDIYVSSDYSHPIWFKYLPGGENMAEDVYAVRDPGFKSPDSLFGDTREWNFSTSSTQSSNVNLQYSGDIGCPADLGGSGPGSARIVFSRGPKPREAAGIVKVYFTKEFQYPNKPSPKRFTVTLAFLANGAEDVPIETRIFVTNSSGYTFYFWTSPTISTTTTSWTFPSTPIDSYESTLKGRIESSELNPTPGQTGVDPAQVLFPTQGLYKFGLEIFFKDENPGTVSKDIVVNIDDLSLRLYGNAYGVLGTDHQGRDIFAQLVYGARISLFVGLTAAVLSVLVGLLVGLICGYLGRAVDEILMRLTDALLVLPSLPLLLVLIAVIGPSIINLVLLIGLLGWMGFARMVRSQTLSLKERPFVEAAKAVGSGKWHIIGRHILPNVMSLVYVSLALSVPTAILEEAALSWLGLFDPTVTSWGRMLHDAQFEQGIERWWWVVPPGISIALVSVSFILIGYALDEILNPKLRQRR